ncbi:MAG: hypothetical protein QOE70_6173 [Chthoniobacter sp.]|nr:hypothetical protein [Chthoniobacter sp.]
MSWVGEINWQTPAGKTLRELIHALPNDREWSLTLFGSSPLQLAIEPTFTSRDLDLFATDETQVAVEELLSRTGLADQTRDVYIQLCVEGNFRTSPRWLRRAWTTKMGHVQLTLPHPIDLLIAKLHRLEDKDLRAFRLVIERTGHPEEHEMRRELQVAVDLYRPGFDEEMVGDITTNTRVLWQELWGKDIDVRQEIIAPARAAIMKGYEPDLSRRDYKAELRRMAEE